MKRFVSLIMGLVLLFVACDRDDEDDSPSTMNQNRIQIDNDEIFVGEWRVTQFLDGVEDETRSFKNITINFKAEGAIDVLRNNNVIATGNWFLVENGKELWIQIPDFASETNQFGEDIYEINDDWYISRANGTELHLFEENEVLHLAR